MIAHTTSNDLLGVGVNCEDIARWHALLPGLRRPPQGRLFFPKERRYCEATADPPVAYAECWCGKEAIMKALSALADLTPRDVLNLRSPRES